MEVHISGSENPEVVKKGVKTDITLNIDVQNLDKDSNGRNKYFKQKLKLVKSNSNSPG